VTAKKFQDIVAWQLADELRRQIAVVSSSGSFADQHAGMTKLAARAGIAAARLHAYLRTAKPPMPKNPSEPL